jgi:hypothetical protein
VSYQNVISLVGPSLGLTKQFENLSSDCYKIFFVEFTKSYRGISIYMYIKKSQRLLFTETYVLFFVHTQQTRLHTRIYRVESDFISMCI